jgi:hypothetical protein
MIRGEHNAAEVIKAIRRHADLYEAMVGGASDKAAGELVDHIVATKTNTVWPLLLTAYDNRRNVPTSQRRTAVAAIGSYLMRRGVCGLTTKDYNRIFVSVLKASHNVRADQFGDAVEATLSGFTGETRMWPEDGEFFGALLGSNFYSLPKPRVRAFLAGIENHLRDDLAEETGRIRADNSQLNIEHVLPQSWQKHWPLPEGNDPDRAQELREQAINTVGNLTLTNGKLNAKMQNEGWLAKRPELQAKSTLLITTASILADPGGANDGVSEWNEHTIGRRSAYLIGQALETWPRPETTIADESRWDDSSAAQDMDDD